MTYTELVDAVCQDTGKSMSKTCFSGAGKARAINSLNVTLILSGSIAAYKACELASALIKAGHEVQTVATKSALRFVGKASLEGLTDRKVYTSLWAPRENKTHITLRRWTDVFVFYPATANRINKLAAGIAEDLVGALFLANNFEKPFYIAPAMNTNMLMHPATQESIIRLTSWGVRFVYGNDGRLACGDIGAGRLAEPEEMFSRIEREGAITAGKRISAWVQRQNTQKDTQDDLQEEAQRDAPQNDDSATLRQQRILVTGGAMKEPIDKVRYIMNFSSGRTASAMVNALVQSGWDVDYLHHRSALLEGSEGAIRYVYDTYEEFAEKFSSLLREKRYDAVFHASAVSDYHVERIEYRVGKGTTGYGVGEAATAVEGVGKISSDLVISLVLGKNEKQLSKVEGYAGYRPCIMACKLTSGLDEENGLKKAAEYIASGNADLVVWNDTQGMVDGRHEFILLLKDSNDRIVECARGKFLQELCEAAVAALNGRTIDKPVTKREVAN